MVIRVKFFALLRERAGASELSLEVPDGCTVAEASNALVQRVPAIANYLSRIAFAVNRDYVPRQTKLHDGDELALIPPVSGG